MLVPCGKHPNATCTPFALSLSASNGSPRQIEPAEQTVQVAVCCLLRDVICGLMSRRAEAA